MATCHDDVALLSVFEFIFTVSQCLKKDGNNSEYMSPLRFCGIFLHDQADVFLPAAVNGTATPPLKKSGHPEYDETILAHSG